MGVLLRPNLFFLEKKFSSLLTLIFLDCATMLNFIEKKRDKPDYGAQLHFENRGADILLTYCQPACIECVYLASSREEKL